MKKIVLIFVLAGITIHGISAQQDPQYTQYMYNTMVINPAYAGSRGVFSVAALHRSQWVGLDGAPTTQTLSLHTPVKKRVGLGLSFVNDEIGNGTSQTKYMDADFSYTIPISESDKLSFGLKAGGQILNIDFNKLRNYNSDAVIGTPNIDHKFSPNFGAGIYYYNNEFYAGLSAPNFLSTQHFDSSGETSYLASDRMNWYLITGYVFDLDQDWKLKPALLFKVVKGAPVQADLSATFFWKDKLSIGAAYRWDAALSALVGFQLSDSFLIGLAYDKETTELGGAQFNDGSFEVILRYELRTRFNRKVVPRLF